MASMHPVHANQQRQILASPGNAAAALSFACGNLPGTNIHGLQEYVLTHGTAAQAIQFASAVPGANVDQIQRHILEKGTGWDVFCLAVEVERADHRACQTRILAVGTGEDCFRFAKYIPGMDVMALYERAEAVGFSGLDEADRAEFQRMAMPPPAPVQSNRLTLRPADAETQSFLTKFGRPQEIVRFAKEVPSADLHALVSRFVQVCSPLDAYAFARDVRDVDGADVDKLYARAQSLDFAGLSDDQCADFGHLQSPELCLDGHPSPR